MIQSFQYSDAKVLFEHFMLPESVEMISSSSFEAKLKFCTKIPYTTDEFFQKAIEQYTLSLMPFQ